MTRNELARRIDLLYYPAVLCDDKRRILHRNRFAKALLPAPALLSAELRKKSIGSLEEIVLSGARYFVSEKAWSEKLVTLCFFESFHPFYHPFSRLFLEELNGSFWKEFAAFVRGTPNSEERARLIARSARLHAEAESLLGILQLREERALPALSCSLSGFFLRLNEALGDVGVEVQYQEKGPDGVLLPPSSLSFLVLSLVRYAYLLDGAGTLLATAESGAGCLQLTLTLSGTPETFSLLEELLHGTEHPTPRTLFLLPLVSALAVCEREGVPWRLRLDRGKVKFSVALKSAVTPPTAFLASKMGPEIRELWDLAEKLFADL